ncbi:hypothetical protein [Orientia tsutsugamushi]|uniref:Uncharacterized protein n=1 Tax=Orientia tsutsugamushi TaxID=784 RepID=A0A2U3R2Y7_ORITS|nr:hypothetical protein [Orientia tsutsugamushi]KJV72039.1 hypothetical protein OTSUT76_3494 [Orientia tsutsugamushi str. UT76]KJV80274.1 hypothetical protein OTSUT76_1991 [Orientia tsutsugamushi str. UT76]KJV86017.1 hypothetical protein OTSUT76_1577 [Orientia tsutsugamushi str. UT76]SPR05089.1 Uncharacterised protein [Orientia tsutsugamushi]SPR05179.1 Uncharacterised protein [Orientia tsutsugamushi]
MKSWKLQQLEQDLVKIVNNTLISGEIQKIVNPGGETLYLIPGNRYPKLLHKISSMQAK